jgi:spore germination cell wall hydrolase CwlJ-like protein
MLKLLILLVAAASGKAHAPANPERNLLCLEANIYFESGNQPWTGKLAVKDVTLNRGGSVCRTVFARKQFSWTHKQRWAKIESFLLDRPELSVLEQKAWEESKKAAQSDEVVLSKEYKHFHATNVRPYWSATGVVIGNHKFLKGVK